MEKMKKKFTVVFLSLFLIFSPLFLNSVFADQPPDPGGGPGGGDPVGGGSPVGSSLVILLGMAASYGIKKVYQANKH